MFQIHFFDQAVIILIKRYTINAVYIFVRITITVVINRDFNGTIVKAFCIKNLYFNMIVIKHFYVVIVPNTDPRFPEFLQNHRMGRSIFFVLFHVHFLIGYCPVRKILGNRQTGK